MRRFAPGWGMTAVVAMLLPVLVSLGIWQLDRAQQKLAYQNRYLDRAAMAPVRPSESLPQADFRRLRLQGEFLPGQHYLVDNRVREGRPGYWVVSRFADEDGRIYLVNRGWVAAPGSRDRLPDVAAPAGRLSLVGLVWPDTGLPPLLAPDPWPQGWPKRVQRLDVPRMSRQGATAVPAEIRLEPGQPGALASVPLEAGFDPARHRGYAVQWFGLAVVLAVSYLVFAFKPAQENAT